MLFGCSGKRNTFWKENFTFNDLLLIFFFCHQNLKTMGSLFSKKREEQKRWWSWWHLRRQLYLLWMKIFHSRVSSFRDETLVKKKDPYTCFYIYTKQGFLTKATDFCLQICYGKFNKSLTVFWHVIRRRHLSKRKVLTWRSS